jgi:predicted phage terminase large subunit-like protein
VGLLTHGSARTIFSREARRRLGKRRARGELFDPPLRDGWIERYGQRGYTTPHHLDPFLAVLDEAINVGNVRAIVHAPPRHGKTESVISAFAKMLRKHPERTNAFATYGAGLAQEKSQKVLDVSERNGVEFRSRRLGRLTTRQGGGLLATGVGGEFTGRGVSGLMVIDDPFKNRTEAESGQIRGKISQWFKDVAYTRREPGCSIIIMHTRWHPNDLAGEQIAKGWPSIVLPAISEDGHALWPEVHPLTELETIREEVGPFTWTSLYQGQPRSRGGAVFSDVHFYDALPSEGYRDALGFDLAYTAKTSSDYSVVVHLRRVGGVFYVVDVLRKQVKATEFKAYAWPIVKANRRARRRWYHGGGGEVGVADFMREGEAGIDVGPEPARGDKFQRAQPCAAAWNAGKILIPSPKLVEANPKRFAWVDPFVAEVCGFSGLDDEHDDQVDALDAAYDSIADSSALERFRAMAKS